MENIMKKSFLVGGAVRDIVLGIEPKDEDFVVVGCTEDEMLAAGFTKVGADFPVFLHPENGSEYALARRERSTGGGHGDFEVTFDPTVTLEEDLQRRDLTFNAMAMDSEGNLIDPLDGCGSLDVCVMFPVSEEAFVEDPLRVLRLARFSCRDEFSDFQITKKFADMIRSVDLSQLSSERVSAELFKALLSDHPRNFFDFLRSVNQLDVWFPEVKALIGQTQPEKWHPEGDAYQHTMQVINSASDNSNEIHIVLAALCHDFGKGVTPKEVLPTHHGHEKAGVPITEAFCDRLKVSKKIKNFCVLVTELHGHVHSFEFLIPRTFVKMYNMLGSQDAFEFNSKFPRISYYDANGRGTANQPTYSNDTKMIMVFRAINNVKLTASEIAKNKNTPEHLKNVLHAKRIRAAEAARKNML